MSRPLQDQLTMRLSILADAAVLGRVADFPLETARSMLGQYERAATRFQVLERLPLSNSMGDPLVGRWGPIYAATAVMPGQQRSRVVIKKMQDGLNPGERQAAVELIVREAGILFSLKSPHVLPCRAIGTDAAGEPNMLVLPHFERDSLKSYLLESSPGPGMTTLSPETRIGMVCDIAKGLEYLMGRGIVMKDLGARSCMVMASLAVVVGDLGDEGRFNTEDYYRGGKDNMPLPARWMAPEVLAIASKDPQSWWVPLDGTPMRKVLTKEADMWALGVTMWEVMTFASLPFGNLSDSKFISAMKKSPPQLGAHEHLPPACGGDLISWCMTRAPAERPSIASALGELRTLVGSRGAVPGSPRSPMMNRALLPVQKAKGGALPAAVSGAGAVADPNAYEYMDAARAAALKAEAEAMGGRLTAPAVPARPTLDVTSAPSSPQPPRRGVPTPEAPPAPPRRREGDPLAPFSPSPLAPAPVPPRRYVDYRPPGLGKPQPRAGTGGAPPAEFRPSAGLPSLSEDADRRPSEDAKNATLMMSDSVLDMMMMHMDSPKGMDPELFQNAAAYEASRLRTDAGASSASDLFRQHSSGGVLSEGSETGSDFTDNDSGPGTPDVNTRSSGRRRNHKLEKRLKDACRKGNFDKMCALVATPGLNVDATRARGSGRTAMYCASEVGEQRIVAKLIEADADPFKKTRDGLTALDIADKNGFADIAGLLRSYMDRLRPGWENAAAASFKPARESSAARRTASPLPPILTKAQLLSPPPSTPLVMTPRAIPLAPPSPMMARSIIEEARAPSVPGAPEVNAPGPGRVLAVAQDDMYIYGVDNVTAAAEVQRCPPRAGGVTRNTPDRLSMHEVAMRASKGAPPGYQTSPLYEVPVMANPDYMSSQDAHNAIQRQIMGEPAATAGGDLYESPDLIPTSRRTQADADAGSSDSDDDRYGVVMTAAQLATLHTDRARSETAGTGAGVLNYDESEYLPLEGLGGRLIEAKDEVEPGDVAEVKIPAGAQDVTDEGTVIRTLSLDEGGDIGSDEDLIRRQASGKRKNSAC